MKEYATLVQYCMLMCIILILLFMYFIFKAFSNSKPLLVLIVKLPDSITSVFFCSSNKKKRKFYYDSQQFQQTDNHISCKIIEFKIVTKYGIGNPSEWLSTVTKVWYG